MTSQNTDLSSWDTLYVNLIMISYTIIPGSIILNIFMLTYDDILYPKCLLCIYVLPEDGPRRPKHVGEIIMTKQIVMHKYLQLVGMNTV
jgi:hypothetical protein